MRIEIGNEKEFLEHPIGEVCNSLIEVVETEDVKGGVLVMIATDENGDGYRFDLSIEKVDGKKSLKDKLKFWG